MTAAVSCMAKRNVTPYKQQKFLREYQLYDNKDHITFIVWGRSIDEIKKLHIFIANNMLERLF